MKKIIIGMGCLLLVLGCSSNQPKTKSSFNPARKGIVFVQGKAYRVPHGSNFDNSPMGKDSVLTLKHVYHKHGVPCKIGDLGWRERTLDAEFRRYSAQEDWDKAEKVLVATVRSGKIGCAHPLSDKEYEFYRSKEIQASNYLAATAPRNYNVNVTHTGYINRTL